MSKSKQIQHMLPDRGEFRRVVKLGGGVVFALCESSAVHHGYVPSTEIPDKTGAPCDPVQHLPDKGVEHTVRTKIALLSVRTTTGRQIDHGA